MYAVIEFAGHQYKVKEGEKFEVNSLDAKKGDKVKVDSVLMTFDEKGSSVKVGTPFVSGTVVEMKVVEHKKGDKVRVYKKLPKKRYERNKGHRQALTVVEIVKIGAGTASKETAKKALAKKTEAKKTTKKAPAKKATKKKES